MIKNLRHKIIAFILFCIPMIYIIYLFYIRIVISRAPRDITIIYSNYKIYLLAIIISGFAIRIYVLLKMLEIIPTKEPKRFLIKNFKIILYVINHYLILLKSNFIRELASRVRNFTDFSLWLIQKSYWYIKTERFVVIQFICEIGTKLIVLVVFLIEVFYFKQLNYFYKVLGLLLIPLITSFLIDIMIVFYNDNIAPIIGFLDSQPIEGTDYHEFRFYDDNLVPPFVSSLDDFVDNHLSPVFDFMYTHAKMGHNRIKYKSKHFLLLINLCYFITWTYVLLVGLTVITN